MYDEVVVEVLEGEKFIEEMNKIMFVVFDWVEGLLLNVEGFEMKYYMKD